MSRAPVSITPLTSIDLAPLRAIEEFPEGFLRGCSGLKGIDLSPLVNVKERSTIVI